MERSYQSELTREHYLEFQKYICGRLMKQPTVKRWQIGALVSLWFFIFSFVLFAIESYKLVSSYPSQSLTNALILAVASIIVWFILSRFLQKSVMSMGASESGTMLGETTHTISAAGVSEVGIRHRFKCSWEAVTEVIETPNLIIFLTDPAKGVMCPRASIPDEEYKALLAYSRERIAK